VSGQAAVKLCGAGELPAPQLQETTPLPSLGKGSGLVVTAYETSIKEVSVKNNKVFISDDEGEIALQDLSLSDLEEHEKDALITALLQIIERGYKKVMVVK
jgi:hypothetical protein